MVHNSFIETTFIAIIMKQYTQRYVVMLLPNQAQTMKRLKVKYKINPAHFIRDAIAEKLQRERLEIKERIKESVPF